MRRYARYVTRLVAIGLILLSATFVGLMTHTVIENVRRPSSQEAWTEAMLSAGKAVRADKEGRHDEALILLRTAQAHAEAIANLEKRVQALAYIGRGAISA